MMRAAVERSPFASPWVRQVIQRHGLPLWFGLNAIGGFALSVRDTSLLYFDARLYLMATQAWLAGGDPWDVQLAGNYFAAPPPSLLPLAPLAPLPLDLGVAIVAVACFAAAIATVRLLGLPWWWLLFPPLVQCLLSANVHALLIPLILLRIGWLATMLKIYAAVPVAILGHWRVLLMAIGLLLITAPSCRGPPTSPRLARSPHDWPSRPSTTSRYPSSWRSRLRWASASCSSDESERRG